MALTFAVQSIKKISKKIVSRNKTIFIKKLQNLKIFLQTGNNVKHKTAGIFFRKRDDFNDFTTFAFYLLDN